MLHLRPDCSKVRPLLPQFPHPWNPLVGHVGSRLASAPWKITEMHTRSPYPCSWFSCVTTASKEALTLFLEHRISISASTLMLLAQQSLTIFDTLADVHAQTGILPSLIIEQCEEARRSSPFDALPLASLSHIARKGKNKVYC